MKECGLMQLSLQFLLIGSGIITINGLSQMSFILWSTHILSMITVDMHLFILMVVGTQQSKKS